MRDELLSFVEAVGRLIYVSRAVRIVVESLNDCARSIGDDLSGVEMIGAKIILLPLSARPGGSGGETTFLSAIVVPNLPGYPAPALLAIALHQSYDHASHASRLQAPAESFLHAP